MYKIVKLINLEALSMKTVTATELKTKTGETLDAAQKEPVSIEKNGRAVAVIIPQAEYERFTRLENDYWMSRIESAEASGYIGVEATHALIKDRLKKNAKS
ncbi:MAG: type II toxin-antitoxin system Phd/YefM family antitoxin [Candidatus Obscuribacterales bacterium]|nr:type II toxin-antitoxin system Phd/YefM family antitoxin [Candidatus Obscuribacterales bacterium]